MKAYHDMGFEGPLRPDHGRMIWGETGIIAAEGLKANSQFKENWEELKEIFRKPSLKMASFTVTEKGYSLDNNV